jgi:ammonia channel protein AmtB
MMFAVITPLLITGAFAERVKWNAFVVFIVAWSIFIYYPLAHWIWGRGWLAELGVFDFAGGIVIHTSAGLGSLAAALVLGRRKNFGPDIMVPHNIPLAILLLKEHLKIDDALDVSSVHGVTGIVGSLAIGLIASTLINPAGPDGLLYGNPMQLAIQALGVAVAATLGFGGTIIIMKIIDATIGLKVRDEEEDIGLDITQHAERAYVS